MASNEIVAQCKNDLKTGRSSYSLSEMYFRSCHKYRLKLMPLTGSGSKQKTKKEEEVPQLPRLSEQLKLEELWAMLSDCLKELARTPDQHAVLILQPAVEAFFIVHAGQ